MSNFWRALLDKLRRDLGLQSHSERVFGLDDELYQTLQNLAEQQQRPPQDVASDLLQTALTRQNAEDDLLRRWEELSLREQQVTALACLGQTNLEIGRRLHISEQTVKSHLRNILSKFELHSKSELRIRLARWDFTGWEDLT